MCTVPLQKEAVSQPNSPQSADSPDAPLPGLHGHGPHSYVLAIPLRSLQSCPHSQTQQASNSLHQSWLAPRVSQFSICTTTHTISYPDARLWVDPRCSTSLMASLEKKNSSSPYTEFNSKQIAQCGLKHDTFRVTEQRNSWLGTERDGRKQG